MAAWSAADVVAFAPEFCDAPLPAIDRVIRLIAGQVSPCWGDNQVLAGVLLTCHYLLVNGAAEYARAQAQPAPGAPTQPGAGREVDSVTVGSVTVSYGSSTSGGSVNPSRPSSVSSAIYNGMQAAFASTIYGQQYIQLRQQTFLGMSLV